MGCEIPLAEGGDLAKELMKLGIGRIKEDEFHKKTIRITGPWGIYLSNNKCPECGSAMKFILKIDMEKIMSSTSHFLVRYSCGNNHKFEMPLDNAIEKYGERL